MIETFTSQKSDAIAPAPCSRRRFLGLAGALAGAGLLTATTESCTKKEEDPGVDLGSGDTGVLNFAYALEQLEAEFYTRVVSKFYAVANTEYSAVEKAFLTDIRDHEIAHREFLKNALGSAAIETLEFDFSSIDFNKRTDVLLAARAFEDLGVTAYNGAGQLLVSDAFLTLAGKIVSVEARHAAAIRDIIADGSFADSTAVDGSGLDGVRDPKGVMSIAGKYFKKRLNLSNLPTS